MSNSLFKKENITFGCSKTINVDVKNSYNCHVKRRKLLRSGEGKTMNAAV